MTGCAMSCPTRWPNSAKLRGATSGIPATSKEAEMTDTPSCGNCRFFMPGSGEDPLGECHRYAPRPVTRLAPATFANPDVFWPIAALCRKYTYGAGEGSKGAHQDFAAAGRSAKP